MRMNYFFVFAVALLITPGVLAQTETDSTRKLTIDGYVEAYYQYDFGQPVTNTRPGFVYSHNRHNEVTVNLGFLRGSYHDNRVRANLAIAAGTYMNANYAAEPGVLKNLYEANVGIKLSNTKKLWLDAGIFGSHIGFESAVGKDNWTLTRGITADNTPYFLSGAKITYLSPNEKWQLTALALNGWQQIQRTDGSRRIALGTQVQFKPVDGLTLNSSTYIGAAPDSTNRNRLFHNFYGQWQVSDKFGLTAGFDYGTQQEQSGSARYASWGSVYALLRYQIARQWWVAGRFENYRDRNETIVTTGTPHGFNIANYSLNVDFAPVTNAIWRLECRWFNSQDPIFADRHQVAVRTNFVLATALAVSF